MDRLFDNYRKSSKGRINIILLLTIIKCYILYWRGGHSINPGKANFNPTGPILANAEIIVSNQEKAAWIII